MRKREVRVVYGNGDCRFERVLIIYEALSCFIVGLFLFQNYFLQNARDIGCSDIAGISTFSFEALVTPPTRDLQLEFIYNKGYIK